MQDIKFQCINSTCDDEKDHLWVNIQKDVFHCWKCDWSGKVSNNQDIQKLVKSASPGKPSHFPLRDSLGLVNIEDFQEVSSLPDWHNAIEYIKLRGVSVELCQLMGGAYCPSGTLSGRIVFPIKNKDVTVAWQGRSVYDKEPKYMTYGKKNLGIFSMKPINQYNNFIIIFEGVFDVLKIPEYGIAILGKNMSPEQLRMFTAFLNVGTIFIMLDSDAREKVEILTNKLSEYFLTVPIFLESGDPGDLTKKEILELCQQNLI